MSTVNPFNLTQATHFSDEQIQEFWVDIPGGGGLLGMLKPTSRMPMLVLGGKGSGKTHLLRYCSFELQRLKARGTLAERIKQDGFLGVFMRCEGLNANRFSGKGQTEDLWNSIFEYYMDLSLADLLLSHVAEISSGGGGTTKGHGSFCAGVTGLFKRGAVPAGIASIDALVRFLRDLMENIDVEVNNCAIKKSINVEILCTRGRLVFGIPELLRVHFPVLKNVIVVYLLDELENFSSDQQKYIFTLLRERRGQASFKIGARLYGIKTYATLSGDEEIKEGSEYERLPLDELLRKNSKYVEFAKRLVAARVANMLLSRPGDVDKVASTLREMFGGYAASRFCSGQVAFVASKYKGRERPYFAKLRRALGEAGRKPGGAALASADVDSIIESLRVPEEPLLEKTNAYLLYRAWSDRADLRSAARRIQAECSAFRGREKNAYAEVYSHYSGDLLAQLLRECDKDQEYLGLESFIHMSMGMPRNLLIILKHVFNWSVFNGESPFQTGVISVNSQQRGVIQAAEWFLRDASARASDGAILEEATRRLAQLFREVRFSDKPTECSLCSFSVDLSQISQQAKRFLELAENYSLLIRIVEGQADRNSMRVDSKFQLNSMLAPLWDLPIYRRGAIPLDAEMVNAIFDPTSAARFAAHLKNRVAGMKVPFRSGKRVAAGQFELFTEHD